MLSPIVSMGKWRKDVFKSNIKLADLGPALITPVCQISGYLAEHNRIFNLFDQFLAYFVTSTGNFHRTLDLVKSSEFRATK